MRNKVLGVFHLLMACFWLALSIAICKSIAESQIPKYLQDCLYGCICHE